MPKVNIKFLMLGFFAAIIFSGTMALAQITTPNLTGAPAADKAASKGVTEDDPLLNAPMTAEGLKNSYDRRAVQRQQELAAGGFKWMPWSDMGEPVLAFIKDRDPKMAMITGDPKFRDFALADIDGDQSPDVITYDWTDCVAAGCPAAIFFSNKIQKPVSFIVRIIKPFKHGVTVDGTYYEF